LYVASGIGSLETRNLNLKLDPKAPKKRLSFFTLTMSDFAETSSQGLEKFLTAQLEGLGISIPSDDLEYIARFVEEDGLEVDEKVEGVKGMLEGLVEVGPAWWPADSVGPS
jgi:hypothetical protein